MRSKSHSSHVHVPTIIGGRPQSYRNWRKESLTEACKAVAEGELSVRMAAEQYDIPRSTLHDHVSGKVAMGSRSGPRAYLTMQEEEELITFLKEINSIGYTRTISQVIGIVQAVVNSKGFDVKVSNSWYKSFKMRHKEFVLRNPEPLTHSRIRGVSHSFIESYFDLLETTITEAGLQEKPCHIYNLDETGFPLNPKAPKIIAVKGEKHPSAVTSFDRSQMTVLACCNAGGYAIPPLVIFDRKSLKPELAKGEVPGTMYGLSDNGWMNCEIFEQWFLYHFLPYATPARPLLLLMDGSSTHFSPLFVNKAAEEKVIVFCLPPNSTHKAQPLDKGVFSPLKRAWREECHNYLLCNPGKVVTRYQFSILFGRAWLRAMTPKNIISGFSVTGVYPTDRLVYPTLVLYFCRIL